MTSTVRNVLIVLALAALVVVIPGGGTGAAVTGQALYLVFLGAIAWFAALQYREHRVALYSLGDGRRAILYGAIAVAILTIAAKDRLFHAGGAGTIVWFVLLGGAAYGVFAVVWSARRY